MRLWIILVPLLSGCSLLTSQLTFVEEDADVHIDAGDASTPTDAGPDAGQPVDASFDAGPPPDDAGPDAGSDGGTDGGGVDAGCLAPLRMCGPSCVDVTNSDDHCGACNSPCADGTYCADSECRPSVGLATRYGGTASDSINSVVVDTAGNLYVVGTFADTVNFGGGPVPTAGGVDAFVASFAESGAFRWFTPLGGTGEDVANSVAFDPTIGVVAVGRFEGTASVDGATIDSAGSTDMFVVALNPDTGSHRWSRSIGGLAADDARRVATAPGRVYIGGRYEAGFMFGADPLTGLEAPDGGIFALTATASTSTPLWVFVIEGAMGDVFDGIDASASLICAAGFFEDTTDLGGTVVLTSSGGLDGLVVCVTPAGVLDWHLQFANTGSDLMGQVAIGSDFVAMVGIFEGTTSFATSPLVSGGHWDAFVATASLDGAPRWARSVSSPGEFDFPTHVSVDASDQIVVTTIVNGAPTVGGNLLPYSAAADWSVSSWDADGTLAWARAWGGSMGDNPQGSFRSPTGPLWVVGAMQDTVDFGTPLISDGDNDGAIIRLDL